MPAWLRRYLPLILLVAITAVGLALRLYQLGPLPAGMHPDEGYNALDALDVLNGARPIFFERNNGREPLFIYFIAGLVGLFGPSIWAVRLAGAIAGVLIIPAQYLFVQSLPLPRARLVALVSAALLAMSFWPVHQSHRGLRAGLLPLWVALLLWAWWRALETWRGQPGDTGGWPTRLAPWAWSVAAGVTLALANYTYLLARLLPLILVGSALWESWQSRRWQPLFLSGVALATAGILLLPLALYFLDNPQMLMYRADQVSVLNPAVNDGNPWGTLASNGWNLLLAFNVRGPTWWYENLAGRPVFDLLSGVLFLVGLALLARDLSRPRSSVAQAAAVLLTLTLGVTLLPSWLSDGAPTYIRLTAIWPVLFLLPAWGLVWSTYRLSAILWRGDDTRQPDLGRNGLAVGMIIGVVALSAFISYRDLFVRYASAPQMARGTRVATAENAQLVATMVADGPTYVSPAIWVQPVIRFVNNDHPPGVFDPRAGLLLPPAGDARYVFDLVEAQDAEAFGQRWPQFQRDDASNSQGEPSLIVYRLARERWPGPRGDFLYRDRAVFGNKVRLLGHETKASVAAGKTLPVTLEWEVLAPTDTDHNFFVHLVAADGRTIAQYDGAPLGGSYLSNHWRPGERLLQTVNLRVAPDAPAGASTLRVGWYDWRDGQRIPVHGDDDAAVDIGQTLVER